MTTTKTPTTKENILYLITAEGVQKQKILADRISVGKARISQLKTELVGEGMIKEEGDLLYPTRKAYQRIMDSPYIRDFEGFKESEFSQGVRIRNVSVRLKKRKSAATAGEEWIDKVTKKSETSWNKPKGSDNWIMMKSDYVIRLCPDAVVIYFQEIQDNSLASAKERTIQKSYEIIEKLEDEANITLKIDDACFDAEIRGDEIKMLKEPEIFKAGNNELQIQELDTEQEVFDIWSEEDEGYFNITPKPTESQIEEYRKLWRSFLYNAEEWSEIPRRVAKIEEKIHSLESNF